MANILLTEKCVRSCPYCFAKKHMDDSEDNYLSWENLIYITDLLEISHEKRVALLGGEPTLHPHFVDFVVYLFERGFQVNVFTCGIMSDKRFQELAEYLHNVPPERFSFTCNLNHPDLSSDEELKKIDRFLKEFGRQVTLGYNIYEPDFDLDFLFDAINRYHLIRHVRIGLTHPIPYESNRYVRIEDMKKMAAKFLSYAPVFQRLKIAPSFDCGMPLCIFTEEELGILYKTSNGRLSFGCGPAVDIGPDMKVWSCFPLSNLEKRSLYDFNSIQEVVEFYSSVHRKVRIETGGILEECDDCIHRERKLCQGGCIAHFAKDYIEHVLKPSRQGESIPAEKT